MRFLYALALLAALSPTASAQRLLVPAEYPTIQQAIDAAADGDTVLVADGRYVENIRFHGKAIVVASHFALDRDPAHIEATVIDGSQPAHQDTASVVLFIDGEGPGSVIEGFTLTGGTGTRWLDEHGAGYYVEGGGVLAALSSPVIRHNRIVGNRADRRPPPNTASAGGGGIRVGDGAAVIEHNVIADNRAMYGAGIVANYAQATIRNNVIVDNEVYQAVSGAPTFGGGGVWTNGNGATLVENNTIVGNVVSGGGSPWAGQGGGAFAANGMTLTLRNNVIWGNTQPIGGQVARLDTGVIDTYYNDVEGGYTSTVGTHVGNLDVDPAFADADYHLAPGSPLVDAGDPDTAYNDPEAPGQPGQAAPPALGTVRADMGAYGGPGAAALVAVPTAAEPTPEPTGALRGAEVYPNPTRDAATLRVHLAAPDAVEVRVYDVRGALVRVLATGPRAAGTHTLGWDGRDAGGHRVAAGLYLVQVHTREGIVTQPLVVLR